MKTKLIALIAFVVVAAAAIAGYLLMFGNRVKVVDKPKQGSNVITFGDSLVTGYGVKTIGDDFVSLLEKRTGYKIINAGANGDTTASALGRIEKDVLAQDPRIVMVVLGGN